MLGNKINNIPDGWKVEHIEDFASIKTGTGDTQDREDGGKYPFFVRSNTIERVNKYTFDGEGVLTSGDGVGVGKIYHYVNGKFHYHQRVYNIHNFKPHVLGRYFYQFFRYRFFQRVSRMSAKGSVDSVRMEMIAKMSILIPTIEEQQKIADILSTVDKKIDLIEQKIAETEKLKTSLMQKLFSEGVGVQDENGNWQPHTEFSSDLVPSSWEVGEVIDFLELQRGHDLPVQSRMGGSVPIIGSNGIAGYHSQAVVEESGVITGRSGTLGKVYFSEGSFWPLNTSLYIKDFKGNSKKYCFYFLENLNLKRFGTGTGVPTLNRNIVHRQKAAFPPLIEQEKITEILDAVSLKKQILEQQKAETQQLKKGLMQKLLTGEWRVPVEETEAA